MILVWCRDVTPYLQEVYCKLHRKSRSKVRVLYVTLIISISTVTGKHLQDDGQGCLWQSIPAAGQVANKNFEIF